MSSKRGSTAEDVCGSPYFNISGEILQIPGAFPFFSRDMAFEISVWVGEEQHTRSEGTDAKTSASIDGENTAGGLFRRSLKYPFHLSNIRGRSERREPLVSLMGAVILGPPALSLLKRLNAPCRLFFSKRASPSEAILLAHSCLSWRRDLLLAKPARGIYSDGTRSMKGSYTPAWGTCMDSARWSSATLRPRRLLQRQKTLSISNWMTCSWEYRVVIFLSASVTSTQYRAHWGCHWISHSARMGVAQAMTTLIDCWPSAQKNKLRVGGSWFPRKEIHRATWYSNDGVTRKEIDHILVGTRWKLLMSCRVYRSFEFSSDHRPVVATLRLHLRCHSPPCLSGAKRFDSQRLADPVIECQYVCALEEVLHSDPPPSGSSVEDMWKSFRQGVCSAAERVIPPKEARKERVDLRGHTSYSEHEKRGKTRRGYWEVQSTLSTLTFIFKSWNLHTLKLNNENLWNVDVHIRGGGDACGQGRGSGS